MPSGTRISEPLNTGIAAIRPNSVSLRPSVCLSGMPRIANIIQTAKQTVNANVLAISTGIACRSMEGGEAAMDVLSKRRNVPSVRSRRVRAYSPGERRVGALRGGRTSSIGAAVKNLQ
ncbi:hypothetical protein [Burkholderia ubonensis]|uniref:hypothetical protein n=1 Tax=Burkholderia ubonensis TaxID=101571 RepID=UPI000A77ED46